jgi:hypothetical protein
MIETTIRNLLVSFFLRQLAKFSRSLDKVQLRVDLEDRIRKLVPGELFDDAMVDFSIRVLDILFTLLEIEEKAVLLIKLVADKKYEEALTYLLEYVNIEL